jgi:hypothetical protein
MGVGKMNTSFWILLALVFLLIIAAIAIKVIAFFTAEPRVMVDYLAEYNRISKPDGFDPNDNAAELYKKAYEVYVKPSKEAADAGAKWYADINEADKAALQGWLEKNAQCMKYLEEGNRKKFFWAETCINLVYQEETERNKEEKIKKSEIAFWAGGDGATIFEQRARVAAMDGRFADALKDLIECWRLGQHYTNPNFFAYYQIAAMDTEEKAIEMAFQILDRYKLDANDLRLWQEGWQKVFDEDVYRLGFRSDRLIWYGYIQKYFAYHPTGKGRLAWKKAKEFDEGKIVTYVEKDGKRYDVWIRRGLNPRYSCLFGATSNEVKGIVDYICEHYQQYGDKSPWFWFNTEEKFQKEIKDWRTKHLIPDSFILPNLKPLKLLWLRYHRLKAKSSGLITVIAVLRFKAEQNHYPKNLEVLRPREGFVYLAKMPKDPFSEGLLVYHWLVDDFEIYSVGPDFKDDGGKRTHNSYPFSGSDEGDDVFWPPFRLNRENVKFYPYRDERPGPSSVMSKSSYFYRFRELRRQIMNSIKHQVWFLQDFFSVQRNMEMVPAERIQQIQNVVEVSAYNALKYEEWSGKIRPFKVKLYARCTDADKIAAIMEAIRKLDVSYDRLPFFPSHLCFRNKSSRLLCMGFFIGNEKWVAGWDYSDSSGELYDALQNAGFVGPPSPEPAKQPQLSRQQ